MIWAIILILVVGAFIIIGVSASDKQKEMDKKELARLKRLEISLLIISPS